MFVEAMLWGAFPVLALLAYNFLSPLKVLAWSTFFASIFFGLLLFLQKRWKEIFVREAWLPILILTLISGILYPTFYFLGLRFTTAGNAAIVAQMEIVFSFLFFGLILKREKYTMFAVVGAALMFAGVIAVFFSGKFTINPGDALILFATMIAPISNNFQQKARKKVSAVTLLFLRSLIASIFLFCFANFWQETGVNNLTKALPLLLINGIFVFGLSKIFWIEAIHRIPVAKAISLNAITPIFTLIYAFFLLHEVPTIWQFIALPLIIGGGILLTRKNFLHKISSLN